MKLIDKNEAIEILGKLFFNHNSLSEYVNYDYEIGFHDGVDAAIRIISDMPTVNDEINDRLT